MFGVLAELLDRPAWHAKAACRGRSDVTWFPGRGERSSRFLLLVGLPNGHTANVVVAALADKMTELRVDLRRSLTWDHGSEMAHHADFTVASGMPVYFCDPRSPWQRGSNENTNGLLRQYFPQRGFDLRALTQAELDDVADELNGRPQQTLGWRTPSQALDHAIQ